MPMFRFLQFRLAWWLKVTSLLPNRLDCSLDTVTSVKLSTTKQHALWSLFCSAGFIFLTSSYTLRVITHHAYVLQTFPEPAVCTLRHSPGSRRPAPGCGGPRHSPPAPRSPHRTPSLILARSICSLPGIRGDVGEERKHFLWKGWNAQSLDEFFLYVLVLKLVPHYNTGTK